MIEENTTSQELINRDPDQIRSLVFAGGGAKGYAYVGVYMGLIEHGFPFQNLDHIAGTSVGALFACCIALGLNAEEVKDLMWNFNVRKETAKNKRSSTFFCFSSDAVDESSYGFVNTPFDREWLENIIFEKTNIPNCTFLELHELRNTNKQFKDLYVKATDTNHDISKTFSYEHTPDYIISDCVKLSALIPLLFKGDCAYRKINGIRVVEENPEKPTDKPLLYIDGGMIENYPLDLFDKRGYVFPNEDDPMGMVENRQTLGFRFEGQASNYKKIDKPRDYMSCLANILLDTGQTNKYQQDEFCRRTLCIDSGKVKATDFDLDDAGKTKLAKAGWESVNHYYQTATPFPEEAFSASNQSASQSDRQYTFV
jgi:NTE family protein